MARKTYRTNYGEGSFYYIKSKGIWRGSIEAGYTPDGKRRRITVESKDKAKAWSKFQAKAKQYAEAGEAAIHQAPRLSAWINEWLRRREDQVAPKTMAGDRSLLKYASTAIGHRRLDQLTPQDMRNMVDTIKEAGNNGTYQAKGVTKLKHVLKDALADGYHINQLVMDYTPPKKATSPRTAIPTDDAIRILQAAAHLPDASRWLAALLQGMRQEECLGLTWACVDFEHGLIRVEYQLQELRKDGTGGYKKGSYTDAIQILGAYHLVKPKTKAGIRTIPMIPIMYAALADLRARQGETVGDLVWPSVNDPMRPRASVEDRDAWYALLDSVGVCKLLPDQSTTHYVLHEARHTVATMLMRLEVDPAIRLAIIGHASEASAAAYKHVDMDMARKALNGLAEAFQLAPAQLPSLEAATALPAR